MKNLIIAFSFLYLFPVFGHWNEVVTPTNEDLNTIEIVNGNAFCGGNNGILLKSVDQGETWIEVETSATGNITSIYFINSQIGLFTTSVGTIFKTSNGGKDWTGKQIHDGGINALDFKDELTGIAVGDYGIIFKSIDGGDNWTDIGNQSLFIINDVAFLNDSLVIAVGPYGSYLYSTNSGEKWTYKNTNPPETFFAIEKKNDTTGSIVGANGSYAEFSESDLSIGNISNIDSNEDWLKDIHFIQREDSSLKAMVVGFNSTFQLENNGWENWDIDSVNNLNSLHFFNDTIGIICGLNGKIYKTTSGGFPSSRIKLNQLNLNIYPNPARNTLFIQGNYNQGIISIYNSLGQRVSNTNFINNQIDISNISEGAYYITLQTLKGFSSGKFVKK